MITNKIQQADNEITERKTEATKQIEQKKTKTTKQIEQKKTEATKQIEQKKTEATMEIEQEKTEATKQIEQKKTEATKEATKQIEQKKTEATKKIEQKKTVATTEAFKQIEQKKTEATKQIEQKKTEATKEATKQIEQKKTEATKQIEQKKTEATKQIEQKKTEATKEATKQIEQKETEATMEIEQKKTEATKEIEQKKTEATKEATKQIEQEKTEATKQIEQKKDEGVQTLYDRTEYCTRQIEQKMGDEIKKAEDTIMTKTSVSTTQIDTLTKISCQLIENQTRDRMDHIRQRAKEDYERDAENLRRRLMEHYNNNSRNIPLSILDQSLDKRIIDIYETPKIHRIEIAKDGKRVKKKQQVMTYKELFYPEDTKLNRRIYVQGEPGSGKSTFSAKLVNDWSNRNQSSTAVPSKNAMFDDVFIIRTFKFIFFISLRDARCQTDIMNMIKKQLIDAIYPEQKRDVVYILLHQIIETEFCLVLRDGLDEWVAPDGSCQAEPLMAGFPKDNCTILTTSRPWKLADECIKNSQIDILLEIEGINDPYRFSERILRCILDDSKDCMTTAREIRNFILQRKLTSLSHSPMLYTLVICTWVDTMIEEEHLKGSSLSALYTTLLESLCKKVNDTTGFFNDLNPPQVRCFSSTSYLRPIIQNVNVISNAAFHILFSPEKETSIAFNDRKLSNYLLESEKAFALKAGLISKRKTGKALNASFSFIHKSMQEFLAAYHIARNAHLIDDVISGYLARHKDAYLDISQVFIFLCGLNILAANKLSGMMDKQNAKMMDDSPYMYGYVRINPFQNTIEAGYREAVSNEQTGILLRLSHFQVSHEHKNNLRDINNIWAENTTNVLALAIHIYDRDIHSSPAHRANISC